jgi:protein subunit release factor A
MSELRNRRRVLTVTLDDCRVDTFRAGGKGGQNQNKVASGVRVTHEPSGSVGEARDSRSQLQNKRAAFGRMARTRTFRAWATVEAMTLPSDLIVEYPKPTLAIGVVDARA